MGHKPELDITEEGSRIVEEFEDLHQISSHIAEYQYQWINQQKQSEEGKFNLSATLRKTMDRIIKNSDVDLPDEVVEEIPQDDKEGIAVFITDD